MNNKIFPAEVMDFSIETWLPQIKVRSLIIYNSFLLFVFLILLSLPFSYIDVTVKSSGVIRPITEKYEVKTLRSGTISEIGTEDGKKVTKGQTLIVLSRESNRSKFSENAFYINEHHQFLHDLQLLTTIDLKQEIPVNKLHSPLYKQQYTRFQYSLLEQQSLFEKTRLSYEISEKLFAQKVIASKEFQDNRYEYIKAEAALQALIEQQRSLWQEEMSKYQLSITKIKAEQKQLETEWTNTEVKAPVSGTLQQFTGKYIGGQVQAGEMLGYISPDSSLIAECYLPSKDIGYIKPGMRVKFQVDAFNYNDWGGINGRVVAIDNDFVQIDNKLMFRVKCALNQTELYLKNGYHGKLKKGMSLQARFVLTQRSLFQLLYDKIDDWLNPNKISS
ncbi:HlyD family secretion protein [Solitalea sp. MAHUQ-68]|uniref:HlyD family secretion protein n=1 Tax=Solitalea agri TaxID=2953739 RepID=A0A9X2F3I1_9SPHI|nr:HlyD family efflux transporter periplasmic adaptor subunit [Solitalea agri]MCO4293565.1 HlyD family secretion protein [Solitalea agri]